MKNNIQILDCTLRDGGYLIDWNFKYSNIKRIINDLNQANLDFIEIGYLNSKVSDREKSIFQSIADTAEFLTDTNRKKTIFLAMADVDQFLPEDLIPFESNYIDGIRVVFYKHQIEKALTLCKTIKENGYKLFVQPMVTVDYSIAEYNDLIDVFAELQPDAISIVDSFGYMSKNELKRYFDLLDNKLDASITIGFHSHNNMQLSVLNAESLFSYDTKRTIMIDASLYGMGRCAGNLNTELITNYYNENISYKYNVSRIIELIGDIIYPFFKTKSWGYSPYFYITALYHCHPNYATYLMEEHDVKINEFEKFIKAIPNEWRVKCRKASVLEFYNEFKEKDNE